jgi:hypothetical protein
MLGPVLDEVISWILDERGSQISPDCVKENMEVGGLIGLLAGTSPAADSSHERQDWV